MEEQCHLISLINFTLKIQLFNQTPRLTMVEPYKLEDLIKLSLKKEIQLSKIISLIKLIIF